MSELLRNQMPPAKEKRTEVLQSKVTPSELELIQLKKAEDPKLKGLGMSDFVRIAVHNLLGTQVPDD